MSVDGMGSSDVYGRKRVRRRHIRCLKAKDEAWTFYRTGQYGKALAAFRGLETKGDVAALYGLGVMATNGLGMPRNDEKALVWFREGAAKRLA